MATDKHGLKKWSDVHFFVPGHAPAGGRAIRSKPAIPSVSTGVDSWFLSASARLRAAPVSGLQMPALAPA
jgi:hypothetical protein